MNHPLVISLLLAGAVVVTLSCSLAVVVMGSPLARLHYLGPASLLAPWLVTAAVLVEEGFSQAGLKAIMVAFLLGLQSPVIAHVLGRAIALREGKKLEIEGHGREVL
jgi:multisubunit Na+/H+ antiporter MnhG subunit